ncbi:MAG: hypothetical protein J6S85_14195 [Methanobrevibacter sp.]|nr:hypothetical protein [Methanobrevibacter sp.]
MNPTKKAKKHIKSFLKMRIKWSKYILGFRFPFSGYVTKEQYLSFLVRYMTLYPCDPEYKEEYAFCKNQPAPMNDIYYYFEADDKEGSIHPTHPTWLWWEYIGHDKEWKSKCCIF